MIKSIPLQHVSGHDLVGKPVSTFPDHAPNRIGWGPYIGSKAPPQGRLQPNFRSVLGPNGPDQAASILFTSLTNSRRGTGLASTFGFFRDSELALRSTSGEPWVDALL